MNLSSFLKKFFIFIILISLGGGVFFIHRKLQKIQAPKKSMEVYMCIPSGDFLKPFTLGFSQIAADYFWMKTLDYSGNRLMAEKNYPWLYHIVELVTTLDPQFVWPYYFGGITLSLETGQVEQSNLVLKKAMRYHPDDWQFPFFLGFNYWYHDNNLLKAASYLKIAANLPGSPRFLKTFPARLYNKAGQKEAALVFLREIEKKTQDPNMKAQIEKRIKKIIEGKLEGPQTSRNRSH